MTMGNILGSLGKTKFEIEGDMKMSWGAKIR